MCIFKLKQTLQWKKFVKKTFGNAVVQLFFFYLRQLFLTCSTELDYVVWTNFWLINSSSDFFQRNLEIFKRHFWSLSDVWGCSYLASCKTFFDTIIYCVLMRMVSKIYLLSVEQRYIHFRVKKTGISIIWVITIMSS